VDISVTTLADLNILNLLLYKGIVCKGEIFSHGSKVTIIVKRRQIDRNPNPTQKKDDDKYYVMSLLTIYDFSGKMTWLEASKVPFLGITKLEYKNETLVLHLSHGKLSIATQSINIKIADISEPIAKIRHCPEQ
jgi:hypothetical protein